MTDVRVDDPRLGMAQALILKHPAIIYADPVLAAAAFGIHLHSEFFVCTIPRFTDSMTLPEFETNSSIKFISRDMTVFLEDPPEQFSNQAAIKWLNGVCDPACVKGAMTLPLVSTHIRRWTQTKFYANSAGCFECLVSGYILPSLEVMFVEVVEKVPSEILPIPDTMFQWLDFEVDPMSLDFEFDVEDTMNMLDKLF